MKKIGINIIIAALTCTLYTSCSVKEVILNEKSTTNTADTSNIGNIVAPAYGYLRDIENRSGVWGTIEATTDELAWPARGSDWVTPDLQALSTHSYTPTNSYVKNTWNSFMLGINYCNVALQYLSKLPATDNVNTYMAEIRVIRAICMFKLNDYFGKFPFREYTETDYSTYPKIYNRTEAVARILQELDEVMPTLKDKASLSYGRISKAVAQTLKADVLLNYNVYTGTTKWPETIAICDSIISKGNYALTTDYWALYQYDNETALKNTEAILPIPFNETNGLTGSTWIQITLHYNQKFGNYTSMWNGCCTTPEFVNTWDTTDTRFKDTRLKSVLGFNQGFLIGQQYSPAGVALTTRDNVTPLIFTKDFSISNSTEQAGVRVVKFAPNPSTTNTSSPGSDFPFYRIAHVYLTRAEAKFRNGDVAGALVDVNLVRASRNVKLLTSITLTDIYNERGYEFYWEGGRRTDMVRFGTYTAARTSKNFVTPSYKILLPIPTSAIEANANITQNTGY